jgi:quercetin dioxygenase-like cupin family protein
MMIKHGLGEDDQSTFIDGELSAGHAPPLHVHQHENESFYVLSGPVRFRVGDAEFEAGPTDYVLVPRGTPHAFKVGDEGARMLMMSSSPLLARFMAAGGVEATASEPPPVGPDEFSRVVELAPAYDMTVVGPPLG